MRFRLLVVLLLPLLAWAHEPYFVEIQAGARPYVCHDPHNGQWVEKETKDKRSFLWLEPATRTEILIVYPKSGGKFAIGSEASVRFQCPLAKNSGALKSGFLEVRENNEHYFSARFEGLLPAGQRVQGEMWMGKHGD